MWFGNLLSEPTCGWSGGLNATGQRCATGPRRCRFQNICHHGRLRASWPGLTGGATDRGRAAGVAGRGAGDATTFGRAGGDFGNGNGADGAGREDSWCSDWRRRISMRRLSRISPGVPEMAKVPSVLTSYAPERGISLYPARVLLFSRTLTTETALARPSPALSAGIRLAMSPSLLSTGRRS
jgi:hypothetical protein